MVAQDKASNPRIWAPSTEALKGIENSAALDVRAKRNLPAAVAIVREKPDEDCGIQNNIDSLWTWSVNGVKVAMSLTILTGTIAIIQAVMSYWRDKVLVWWEDVKESWRKFTSNDSDREQRGKSTSGKQTPAKRLVNGRHFDVS